MTHDRCMSCCRGWEQGPAQEHSSTHQGHLGTVTILLRWGAWLGRNEQEMSPLVVAREEQEGEVVRIMEEWIMEHEQVLHWDCTYCMVF